LRTAIHDGKPRIIIDPGEYYVTGDDEIISTLLGSCVSACLWDPVNRIVGMNHFLLASRNAYNKVPLIQSAEGRYGVHAMELLINAMLKAGANKQLLKAKAFGGGNVLKDTEGGGEYFAIGRMNSQFITEFLRNESIPLVSSSLGADYGRVIHFTADDFSVYMKRIETTRQRQLVQQEKAYLKKQLKTQKEQSQHEQSSIQIW